MLTSRAGIVGYPFGACSLSHEQSTPLTQLPENVLGKLWRMAQGLALVLHRGEPGWNSWLHPSLPLTAEALGGVNQWMEDSLSASLCQSAFQIKKYFKIK